MIVVPADRIAAYKNNGWWTDTKIDDLFQSHLGAKPAAEACVDPINSQDLIGRAPLRLTWQETEDLVVRYTALFTKRGLGKDDAIVVQLPNIVELGIIYLACARLGIIVSPAPAQYRENELTYIVERTDARAIVTAARIGDHPHAEMAAGVKASTASVEFILAIGDLANSEDDGSGEPVPERDHNLVKDILGAGAELDALSAEDFSAAGHAVQEADVTADDIVTICWTSGTESSPKGVPRSHNEWLIIGEAVIEAGQVETGDRLLNPFPMVNMAGIATGFISWLLVGGVLVQHQPFDLQLFLQQIREEKANYTVAPPAVLNLLLQNEALLEGIDFQQLSNIGSGSAPLSEWMVDTFHKKHGVQVTNFFVSNEGCCIISTYQDIPDPKDRATYFPRFADGFSWSALLHDRLKSRLVDPDTEEEIDEAGRAGELRLKGPTMFSGYWRAPEINERAFDSDGWFRTGDLFKISGNDRQFYEFSGRLKDVIIRGGMNISSEELEGFLLGHSAVADAAVVGAPDPILGERVCAFVVFKPGEAADLEALNQYLSEEKNAAVFKQIERLEVVDALPRNPVGKILKRDLRETLNA
jgi:acyl-CoA synthetase (AMP-forming)/AMP-acid ligase II